MKTPKEALKIMTQAVEVISTRPNGSVRIQQDFTNCPTMAEQHTAHLTDINYLIKKYKPDELAAYISARSQYRSEILGHDFSSELTVQEARNVIYKSKQEFEKLPDEVKYQFKSHLEFLKFIDNAANADKMVALGLISRKQIDDIAVSASLNPPVVPTPAPAAPIKP